MYNVLIFGTGSGSKRIVDFLKEDEFKDSVNVLAYIDNNKSKTSFNNKEVIAPDKISNYKFDYIIIGSLYYDEIGDQLISLGVSDEKIIPFFKDTYWTHVEGEFPNLILDNKHKFLDVPLGHFYSTFPCIKDIRQNEENIFLNNVKCIEGVELNSDYQKKLFNEFIKYYDEIPFSTEKSTKLRYHYENESFEYSDAITLYSMLRKFKPKKLIEVGCGYSSCVTLDTNELFLSNKLDCTFIEPYPKVFKSLIHKEDKYRLIESDLQAVDLSVFESLSENDILFIDSTHVSKVNSDVNYIIFKILPRLKDGVIIHFHDIFYPFEYPKKWIYRGRFWNEAYLLRAFLQYNSNFKIMFFNNYFVNAYKEDIEKVIPIMAKEPGGSLWIRKVK